MGKNTSFQVSSYAFITLPFFSMARSFYTHLLVAACLALLAAVALGDGHEGGMLDSMMDKGKEMMGEMMAPGPSAMEDMGGKMMEMGKEAMDMLSGDGGN